MSCEFEDPLDLHAMPKCLVQVVSTKATEVAATTKYRYQLMHVLHYTTRLFKLLQPLTTT